MNCEKANQIDVVHHLYLLGYEPKKIKGTDHWYFSPFRNEKEPSFKVNKNKNVWYDHGLGKGGTLVDFMMEFYHCNVIEALQKISSFHEQLSSQNKGNNVRDFHREKPIKNATVHTRENSIKIISAKQPVTDFSLQRYAMKRKIDPQILNKYCHEVAFELQERNYRAIGFKNNAGGYELRNEYFKSGSSPKFISYIDNKAKNLSVFEGFFDLLTHQTFHKNQEQELTNFLVLNSLSFFERSLLLMEKHAGVKLYLDNDEAGRKCTETALKRSAKFQDKSKLYKGSKDLNEWVMTFGKAKKKGYSFRRGL
jgi:CHC2 zinc finger/Toprim-like